MQHPSDSTGPTNSPESAWIEQRGTAPGLHRNLVDLPHQPLAEGSVPWRPGMVTRYFTRLRKRVGLDHLTFRTLRRFMDTYGQELGFSASQVAVRGGHDPSVALRYYIRVVADADRKVARAIASLITPPGPPPGSTATPTVTSDSQNGG